MYTFYLNETYQSDQLCTVPFINMKRADLSCHAEIKWLIASCLIDQSSLIFVDEVCCLYWILIYYGIGWVTHATYLIVEYCVCVYYIYLLQNFFFLLLLNKINHILLFHGKSNIYIVKIKVLTLFFSNLVWVFVILERWNIEQIDLSYYDLFGSLKLVLLNSHTLPIKQEVMFY